MTKHKLTQAVPRWLVVTLSFAFGYLLVYGAFLHVLYAPGVAEQNAEIFSYLTGPLFVDADLGFLSVAERAHMQDVKLLFDVAWLLGILALGVIAGLGIGFWKQRHVLEELLARSLFWTGVTLVVLVFVIGLAALLDFQKFWVLFHVFLFPQGGWAFPQDSTLIALYPLEFFQQFVFRWVLVVLVASVILSLLGKFIDATRRA